MVTLDETRRALTGRELDWLLFDDRGCVALCETAGFGEIPDAALRHGEEKLLEYADAIESILREVEDTGGYREEGQAGPCQRVHRGAPPVPVE